MTSIERTAYPRFKRTITARELLEVYTPTPQELAFVSTVARGERPLLSLVVLLKCFQRLGYFPPLETVPSVIVQHLRSILSVAPEVPTVVTPRTLYKHHHVIREFLGVVSYGRLGRRTVIRAVYQAAQVMDHPADLINVALETLRTERTEFPAFSTLDRIIRRVRTFVNRRLFRQVVAQVSEYNQQRLDAFLVMSLQTKRSPYDRLKVIPKSATRNHLDELLRHLVWLTTFNALLAPLDVIPIGKRHHFAAEARALDAAELKDIALPKRFTLLLCLLERAQIQTRDALADMLIKRLATMHTDGKAELIRLRDAHQAQTEMLIGTFQEVLEALDGEPSDPDAGQRVKAILDSHGTITGLLADCETVMAYHGNNYFPLLWRFYVSHRSTLFRIVRVLTLTSTTQDQSLKTALTYMLSHHRTRRELIPATVDLSFASEQWQRTIIVKKRRKTMLVRRHFEVCVFTYLAAELRSGDVAIAGADTYADYRLQLLPWEACMAEVASYCQEMGLPAEPQAFVTHLRNWLAQTAARVDADFPTNTHVTMNAKGEPVLKRLVRKPLGPTAQALEAVIHDRFPERTLLDILCQQEQRLHWTRHFGPISGSEPKLAAPAERYIQTVFAFGCNIGAAQAARHMQGVSAHMLTFTNQRHVRVETLNTAINEMINDYHRCSLPKLWGDEKRAAADGTKYDLYQDNLLAEYHIRYNGYGGIAYHHVADTYIALFSHFIPCGVWEAIYLIEGLLNNVSDIQPTTIHTDTQGQSTPVFALAHLLGITLMPRIRNWKDLIFYRPSKDTHYAHLEPLFKDVIDWDLIARHWQDLFQVVLSIKAGTIASSVLLRKLGNYSRKNRLYLAFRELGRVVRTAFLLDYISNLELREQVTASTNKAESYNGFAKWLFFGGEGVIAENDPEEQEKRIKYNGLVANAVILQNVRDLTRILRTLIGEGYPVRRADVVALSPYLTRGIKRFGEYTVHLDELMEEGEEGFDLPLNFPDLDSAPVGIS